MNILYYTSKTPKVSRHKKDMFKNLFYKKIISGENSFIKISNSKIISCEIPMACKYYGQIETNNLNLNKIRIFNNL